MATSDSPSASASKDGNRRRVLIPVDGSDHSERAFRWFIKHTYRPDDFVILVHVFQSPAVHAMAYGTPVVIIQQGEWDQLVEKKKGELMAVERRFCEIAKAANFSRYSFTMTQHNCPGAAIVEAARAGKADFVVMGSRGLGKLRRTFLGSVSDYVLHHVGLPILIVPAEKKKSSE